MYLKINEFQVCTCSFVQLGKNKFGLRLWRIAVIQAEIEKEEIVPVY